MYTQRQVETKEKTILLLSEKNRNKLDKDGNKIGVEKVNYYLIGCSKEDCIDIRTNKDFTKEIDSLVKSEGIDKEKIKNVVYIGELDSMKNTSNVVGKFARRKADIREGKPIYYRNYAISKEEQAKRNMFVNVAEDSRTSWNTAIKAVRSKYGLVIEYIK